MMKTSVFVGFPPLSSSSNMCEDSTLRAETVDRTESLVKRKTQSQRLESCRNEWAWPCGQNGVSGRDILAKGKTQSQPWKCSPNK
jgi:hypothetical protein